jgi:SAM-dependent methyltransferase
VADIGSGTGILTRLLLDRGYVVHAVEPNAAMRGAAEAALQAEPGFRSVEGSAEATGLPAQSVQCVTAAQAGHWFDLSTARSEFARILEPGGHVVFIWNQRRVGGSEFLVEYEAFLLRWGVDYREVRARWEPGDELDRFFGLPPHTASHQNLQPLDREGLRARATSSSYMPSQDDPTYGDMLDDLDRIFGRSASAGRVMMEYDTRLFWGAVPTGRQGP